MPLDPQMVGRHGPETQISWDADDALLYAVAVGVGANDPTNGLCLTTENTERISQQVLPSFGVVLAQRAPRPPVGDFDPSKLVHAQQSFEFHRPSLSPAGALTAATAVVAMEQKRSGVLVHLETVCRDPADGTAVLTARSATFIRGEEAATTGRPPVTGWEAPAGRATASKVLSVPRNAALLYRLTGDRNPLHTDPSFSRRGGFTRPILHGMCTYGMAAAALIEGICPDEPARLVTMEGRFSAPVWPGDQLVLERWNADGRGPVRFIVRRDDTVVLDRGFAEFRS